MLPSPIALVGVFSAHELKLAMVQVRTQHLSPTLVRVTGDSLSAHQLLSVTAYQTTSTSYG